MHPKLKKAGLSGSFSVNNRRQALSIFFFLCTILLISSSFLFTGHALAHSVQIDQPPRPQIMLAWLTLLSVQVNRLWHFTVAILFLVPMFHLAWHNGVPIPRAIPMAVPSTPITPSKVLALLISVARVVMRMAISHLCLMLVAFQLRLQAILLTIHPRSRMRTRRHPPGTIRSGSIMV